MFNEVKLKIEDKICLTIIFKVLIKYTTCISVLSSYFSLLSVTFYLKKYFIHRYEIQFVYKN